MSRKVRVDMTGVESFTRCPEGEWLAKLKKADMGTVQGSGDDCIKAQFEVIEGEAKGSSVFETFSLTEKALWKLKSFLEAAGLKSNGKLILDLDKMEGKICIIEVTHDEYNGKKRAHIASYSKPTEEDEESDEDEYDEDEEEEEEEKPVKKTTKKKTTKKAKVEDENDDDEEEEKPVKKPAKKSTKKKAPKKVEEEPEDDDDDDDDDDWEEDDD